MASYHCIDADGNVINTILIDDLEAFTKANPDLAKVYPTLVEASEKPGSPGIGWRYDGEKFTPPAAANEKPRTVESVLAYIDEKLEELKK